jgi:hypothetical protein
MKAAQQLWKARRRLQGRDLPGSAGSKAFEGVEHCVAQ